MRRCLAYLVRGIALWGLVAMGLGAPSLAFAEGPIQVTANAHSLVFGQEVHFHLEVTGRDPIQSIVLAYRTSDTHGTIVETMSFGSDLAVSVDYVHQIGRRYIRPFVEVTYWWTIVDVAQARLTTEPQTFLYADNRFDWQTLTDGIVNVHWYRGDLQVAQQALDVAIAGLDRARQDIDVDAVRTPIDVYLYASPEDLRAALPAALPSRTEALTLYETSVILVSAAPQDVNIPYLRRILPHEVTHALIHEATRSDYDHVPHWLSEGLATSVEYTFAPDPDAQPLLEQAVHEKATIPLDALCAAFPDNSARARLAYAESASVVAYIRDHYGRQGLRDLIAAHADGATCQGGVQRVLGVSLSRLETLWLDSLAPQKPWDAFWDDNGAWIVLLVLLAAAPISILVSLRARIF